MPLPTKITDLFQDWNAAFPIPLGQGEGAVRVWVVKFVEQVAYTYPGEGWGSKSTTLTAPMLGERISQIEPPENAIQSDPEIGKTKMTSWLLVNDISGMSPTPILIDNPEQDTTSQIFRKVLPQNHLGGAHGDTVHADTAPQTQLDRVEQMIGRLAYHLGLR